MWLVSPHSYPRGGRPHTAARSGEVDTLLLAVPVHELLLLLQVGGEQGLDPVQQSLVGLLPVLAQTSDLSP